LRINNVKASGVKITYLSRCLPVVKSPVYGLLVRNLSHEAILGGSIAIRISPDVDRATCAVSDAIRSITASSPSQHTVPFRLEHLGCGQGQFYEGRT
jgi:hypothetical protein